MKQNLEGKDSIEAYHYQHPVDGADDAEQGERHLTEAPNNRLLPRAERISGALSDYFVRSISS
jgi:hypothetical protein